MLSLGRTSFFRPRLNYVILLFFVLLQVPVAKASSEISIFLVSKNKNATVENALLDVPIFGKLIGDKLENRTIVIQKTKEKNLIFFLGKAKAFPKVQTKLSVVSGNTEYSFDLMSAAFKKRAAKSDAPWKKINLISVYSSSSEPSEAQGIAGDLNATIKGLTEKLNKQSSKLVKLEREAIDLKAENSELTVAKEGFDLDNDPTVLNLRDTIDELKSEKVALLASLNKKSDELSKVQEELERLNDIASNENRLAKNDSMNFDSDPRVVALNAKIKELENTVSTSNSTGAQVMTEIATLQVDGLAVDTGSAAGINFEFVELGKPIYQDGCEVTFKITNATGKTLQDIAFSDSFKFYDIDGDALSKKFGDFVYLRYEDKLKDGQHFTDSFTIDRPCNLLGDIKFQQSEDGFVSCRDRKAEKIDCEQFVSHLEGKKLKSFDGEVANKTDDESYSTEQTKLAERNAPSDLGNVPVSICIEGNTEGPFGLAFGSSPGCLELQTSELFSSKHEHDYFSDERACRSEIKEFVSQEKPDELLFVDLDDYNELPVKFGLIKRQILEKKRNVCVYFHRDKMFKIFIDSREFKASESSIIKASLDNKYVKGRGYFAAPRTNLTISLGSQSGSISSGLTGSSDDWSSADKKLAINKSLFCGSGACTGGLNYESVDLARDALEDVMKTLTNQKQKALKQSNF